MKNLNTYINEAWSGVKQQSLKSEIEAWCEEMKIRNYTINSKGEIDVNGNVSLTNRNIKELPHKFGTIIGYFTVERCKNLTSLKNCPYFVEGFFSCSGCSQLDSLKGCPKEVGMDFYCYNCKKLFTEKYIKSLCKVKGDIMT